MENIRTNLSSSLSGISDRLKSAWFRARGRRPFTMGYRAYKEEEVRRVLLRGEFRPDQLPRGYGVDLDERIIEYPWLLTSLPEGPGAVLDAGSALNFRSWLDHPRLASKKIYICTLAPERHSYWELGVSYTFQDLRQTCFRDTFFDYVVCLSTLEHVGLDNGRFYTGQPTLERRAESYVDAVREMARILRPGGTLYLTMPFGRYADLGWLQVFDGRMIDRVIETFRASRTKEQIFRYTEEGWQVSNRREAEDSRYVDLHSQPGWRQGTPVAAEAVACLLLTR